MAEFHRACKVGDVPEGEGVPVQVGDRVIALFRVNGEYHAVDDTRLLMEGLNSSNFRGLEKMLSEKPESADAWVFARGQALLIAETGNLLLLRPPKNQGRDAWQMRATELRDNATALARTIA